MTLVKYVPKKKKNVLMMSSMHSEINIDPTTGAGEEGATGPHSPQAK